MGCRPWGYKETSVSDLAGTHAKWRQISTGTQCWDRSFFNALQEGVPRSHSGFCGLQNS